MTIVNRKLDNIGYYFIGHYNYGEIKVSFEDCGFKFKVDDVRNIGKLFHVFDVNSESGVFIENLKGKYCRIEFDEQLYITRIGHIVKDIWLDIKR